MRPTTHMQRLPRNPPGLLARQQRNNTGHILGHADPPERAPRRNARVDLVPAQRVPAPEVLARVLVVHVALDAAGGDAYQ